MEFEEKTLKSEVIYDGKVVKLVKEEVLLPNGNKGFREIVRHNGGSAVLCEKDGKILLVKQFRSPYKEVVWEIPAGKINDGETPEQTAERELTEEGGIKAERVVKLFETYPSPGYSGEKIYIYKAENITEASQNLDEDEFLTCKWFDKKILKKMIDNGEIKDGKTLIALLYELK